MEYRAVGQRCAVDLQDLRLPISEERALEILKKKGFSLVEIDLIALARSRVGRSLYRRGAKPREAPDVVDCSSFTKWLYGERGLFLPRRSIQQRACGIAIDLRHIAADDLVFTSGRIDYYPYPNNLRDGVGHVGIATRDQTVIHAMNATNGIVETPLEEFLDPDSFRGVRRYLPPERKILTLEASTDQEVETSDDFYWIIHKSLPNPSSL